ncbi:maltose ABC transporter substrate-binding protein [Saccharibacillus sp. CPCC 101409]|uniref:sugar ABC transporter substrate-binding protein n=1 Tax=Saccharibacillus sp. CPCC 101409 TaxID=3058041 RepID=UPI002673D0E3|nr:maltose ABC transporter substrate-binding protein [Saccharibacillus sp. CPCC 101409]MDO3411335.1 maltose ABC transporter substrate-binding protein [Saccharibacillus sp. CPCC 101409]
MRGTRKWGILVVALILALMVTACGGSGSQTTGTDSPNTGGTAATTDNGTTDDPAAQPAEDEELLPEEGAVLKVWDSGDQKAFIEDRAAAFKEKYNVEVQFSEVGADKAMAQMVTDGPAGVGADVFAGLHDQVGQGASAGILMPNDWFEEETRADNSELAVNALTYDGILYGYPKSVETTAVFYNKDLIDSVPADWDGVKEFSGTFTDKAANKYAIMWEVANGYYAFPFFGGFGSYIFGQDGTDPTDIGLNNEQGIEAAAFIQGLHDILPLKTSDINGDIKKSLFADKKLAMNISGPWDIASLKESTPNLAVAMYPKLPNGKDMTPFSGVKAYYVSADTKYPNAAKLWANFASSAESQQKNFEMTGSLPSNTEAASSDAVKNDPLSSVFLQQFEKSVPMPSIPAIAQYWSPMEAAISTIWNDGKDPKEAMDNMVKQMKSNITTGQ